MRMLLLQAIHIFLWKEYELFLLDAVVTLCDRRVPVKMSRGEKNDPEEGEKNEMERRLLASCAPHCPGLSVQVPRAVCLIRDEIPRISFRSLNPKSRLNTEVYSRL